MGGHPREMKWTVTPSEGKDPDSSDLRETFIIFEAFFFNHIFDCSNKPLLLFWVFAVLWSSSFFVSFPLLFFFNFNFLKSITIFSHLLLC